jgi:hypothetical protein
MTESFILMALGIGTLGIGIGYSIPVWRRDSGMGTKSIDEQVRESGADVVMFVNGSGDLIVVDAETGEEVLEFDDAKHEYHGAEIRLDEQGEPVLYDLLVEEKGQPMVLHEKQHDKPYRVPCPNPVSGRCLDARIIYFWRYKGSRCTVLWTGGKQRFRCGS